LRAVEGSVYYVHQPFSALEAAGEKQRKGEGREREREFKQPYTPAQF
jgi:hypothetical protein